MPESGHFTALPAVSATGCLVGIVEWACMRALDGHLDDGEQTLGVHVDFSHEVPTPLGSPLTVGAELTGVEGRHLTFTVKAFDDAARVRARLDGRDGP
ncbi:hypothetical protein [Actinomadura sp. KC06]|uniref:thioesterase family protein n=1 Tax=Actinomadura sp. KC06 TaxID=2530369 RepID=UPI001A9DD588|nr:hypothetical protein [Actinomadura sp. KC06]